MTDRSVCANCGAPAPGLYCPQGQETKLALPSAAAFLRDAEVYLMLFSIALAAIVIAAVGLR